MRLLLLTTALSLTVALLSSGARGQQGSAAEPIVRATIDPPQVVVGQRTTLEIVVLAPNYLTAPPELPNVQVRNAVTRQLRSVNTNEQRGDMTFAGVRFEYDIYPQEPGSYALADQSVRIKYAAEPPVTREVSVALPRIAFDAIVPDAAASLRPFVSASKLTAEQTISRSSEPLKAGDAVTRTITIKAEGTPAMLLPPQKFAAIDGLKLYPAQPVLDDKADDRTGITTASRTDSGTYMLERGGHFSLPTIDIGWWNVDSGKVEQIRLAAASFDVEGGASGDGRTPGDWTWARLRDAIADHWLGNIFAAIAIIGLAWITPATIRRLVQSLRHRRATYLNSEAWFFRRLRIAARSRSASATYFGLLGWLQRFEPIGRAGSIEALVSATDDPILARQITALQEDLFAPKGTAVDWSAHTLIRHVGLARRTLRARARRRRTASALPPQINPVAAQTTRPRNRRVAR